MINIAQQIPVAWSVPASTATAPVAAVAAIRPVQESARNGQPGAGREQGRPVARAERGNEALEVAREGIGAAVNDGRRTTGRTGPDRGEAGDMQTRRETEQNTKQMAADRAAEAARSAQRQELLVNVWKASAAVVDRVLDREGATAVSPAAESRALPGRQPGEQLSLPWPVMPPEARAPMARTDFPAPEDVVAYDERGNSSLAPLEPGGLVSRRV
jgi:hypothetical protein